jgi:hypothetical protein
MDIKKYFRQIILLFLFVLNLTTFLLDWQSIQGITSRTGILILSGNLMLSCLIISMYFISILFYFRAERILFITGLCSLSMLFALEFSKFEQYGRFSNSAIGVYFGLTATVVCFVAHIFLLRKSFNK